MRDLRNRLAVAEQTVSERGYLSPKTTTGAGQASERSIGATGYGPRRGEEGGGGAARPLEGLDEVTAELIVREKVGTSERLSLADMIRTFARAYFDGFFACLRSICCS